MESTGTEKKQGETQRRARGKGIDKSKAILGQVRCLCAVERRHNPSRLSCTISCGVYVPLYVLLCCVF